MTSWLQLFRSSLGLAHQGAAPKVESWGYLKVAVGDGAEVSVYAWVSPRLRNFLECGMASGMSSAALEGTAQDLGIMVAWASRHVTAMGA